MSDKIVCEETWPSSFFVQMGLEYFDKIVTLKWAYTSRRETAGNGFCFPLVMASLVLSNAFKQLWGLLLDCLLLVFCHLLQLFLVWGKLLRDNRGECWSGPHRCSNVVNKQSATPQEKECVTQTWPQVSLKIKIFFVILSKFPGPSILQALNVLANYMNKGKNNCSLTWHTKKPCVSYCH